MTVAGADRALLSRRLITEAIVANNLQVGLTLAILLWPTSASAQVDERSSPHLRNDCRLAAQILTSGEPHPHRLWALERIRACNESGGPALSSVWSSPPTDSSDLDRLYWTTASVRDARVFEAVRSAVTNVSNPTDVRLTGLRVLAAYLDPHIDPNLSDLRPPLDPGGTRRVIGSIDHRLQMEGAAPLPRGYADTIVELFSTLSRSDPDEAVRFGSRRLHERLAPR